MYTIQQQNQVPETRKNATTIPSFCKQIGFRVQALSSSEKKVLLYLLSFYKMPVIRPTNETIARKCGISVRSVSRITNKLQELGFIKKSTRYKRSNSYTLCLSTRLRLEIVRMITTECLKPHEKDIYIDKVNSGLSVSIKSFQSEYVRHTKSIYLNNYLFRLSPLAPIPIIPFQDEQKRERPIMRRGYEARRGNIRKLKKVKAALKQWVVENFDTPSLKEIAQSPSFKKALFTESVKHIAQKLGLGEQHQLKVACIPEGVALAALKQTELAMKRERIRDVFAFYLRCAKKEAQKRNEKIDWLFYHQLCKALGIDPIDLKTPPISSEPPRLEFPKHLMAENQEKPHRPSLAKEWKKEERPKQTPEEFIAGMLECEKKYPTKHPLFGHIYCALNCFNYGVYYQPYTFPKYRPLTPEEMDAGFDVYIEITQKIEAFTNSKT